MSITKMRTIVFCSVFFFYIKNGIKKITIQKILGRPKNISVGIELKQGRGQFLTDH